SKNVTSIGELKMWTGTMNKPFYNIKEENGIITFDFLQSTGIKGVKEEAADDNKIYSPDGTYMGTDRSMLKKGIYIINRKKIVIK
ncbi:MAG: peptidase M6, partial [Prevotella sp.]|nr:peptidase M6 [Prevotella sp.]